MQCHICRESKADKIAIPEVGISFSMGGDDYCFCEECLKTKTAYELFELLATENGYSFPLKYKNGR